MKDVPPSKGICGWMNDPDGYEDWNKKFTQALEIARPLRKKLHDKFYTKYGIKWNCW